MYHDHRVVGPHARLPGFIPCYRLLGSQTPPAHGIHHALHPVSNSGYVPSTRITHGQTD
jgi:hypothetical protein